MTSLHEDQAAGLRRLFDSAQPRIITFATGSAEIGKSALVANLASSIARWNKNVLILDENAQNNTASYFGLETTKDLQDIVDGKHSLDEVILDPIKGVRIMPAKRMVHRLGMFDAEQQKTLLETFLHLSSPGDFILADTSSDYPLSFSPIGLASQDIVIVVSATESAIMDSYALIRKVSLAYTKKRFHVLINNAPSLDEAIGIFSNMAELTCNHGLAHLEYAGFIPFDEKLHQALCLCQPVEALFPESPSARAYRKIAYDLCQWPLPEDEARGLEQFVQQLLHLSHQIDPITIYA